MYMRGWRRYTEARAARLPELLAAAQAAGVNRTLRDGTTAMTPQCKMLAGELWTYGFPVLKSLLREDTIGARLQRLGARPPRLNADQSEAITKTEYHRDDLAGTMIELALPRFLERVVNAREWDPARSTLTTYFVNACLCAYPDVLRKWIKSRAELTGAVDLDGVRRVQRDTELVVQDRETVRKIVIKAPHKVRPILSLLWLGYNVGEIGEKLKLNPSTIRSRLFEFRSKKLLPMIAHGRLVPPAGHALRSPYPTEEDQR